MSEQTPVWPEHLSPGRSIDVAPGVRRIIAPNPGLMTGPGTNTYLLGTDRVALIDPGPDNDDHLDVLREDAGDRIRWILVTHTHIDHSPLAAKLKEQTGAEVIAFGPAPVLRLGEAHALDAHDLEFAPDRRLLDGESLDTGELRIEAVHTPGHASNHLCFGLSGTGLLFTGDHVMSGSTVVIAPPDGDMADYLESLEKVRAMKPRRIAPGHGEMIEDAGAVLDQYMRHRKERESQVLGCLAAGASTGPTTGMSVSELVERIYVDVPAEFHPVARFSVWAHLRKLRAEGRARTDEPSDIDAPWYPAGARPAPPG
jgi:glyoxylase-like metal-dependent hydrolase (beta-lactamase superfamily II)